MVQLLNFFFFITSMVVPRGTAAPVLFQLFVSRDVPTGAPSSNGTLIPILIPEFPFLVYLHSRKFIRSMDRAKSGVLVRASRPILFTDLIGRSSSARNAFFRFVPVLNFLILESMGDRGWLESFCGLSCIQFFRTLFYLPRAKRISQCKTLRPNGQRCVANYKIRCPASIEREIRLAGGTRSTNGRCYTPVDFFKAKVFELIKRIKRRADKRVSLVAKQYQEFVECFGPFPVPLSSSGACLGIGLEALALPTSRLLMAVGHDYYKKVKMNLPLSHGGVCIFLLGVLLSNTKKIQFTQRLPLGPELHMGKERCCLRGLDHLHGPTFHGICGNFLLSKPTSDRFMLEQSLRADLLPILTPASYEKVKLEHFLHRWMKNNEHQNLWFTMFPEKRSFFSIRETTSTTEVAIHTNLFTDLYAPIGTGSSRTGGWYTTIMKLPFLFSIRIGFLLASSGGSRSLLRQLQKEKLHWNRESSVELISSQNSGCGASRPEGSSILGWTGCAVQQQSRIQERSRISSRDEVSVGAIQKAWSILRGVPSLCFHYINVD